MKYKWLFGILLLCPIATLQRSNSLPESLSYIGAVAEYSPVTKVKVGQKVSDVNAENYVKFIEKASEYAVDILVFPESALSHTPSYIPDPIDEIIPCLDAEGKYANSLKMISCAARDHSMYVVVNHHEKFDCDPEELEASCPRAQRLIYNTNVAFDRTGKVVARYRKFNLFGEWGVNATARPEHSTFRADFGVTFGQFVCFDLMFEKPALSLVRDFAVTDVLFSAHWFSELPYLFAVQAQAGWAYANDVNMLAAGYSNPGTASGGSGIYVGRKGYTHVTSESKKSNILIVSEIPKVIKGKRMLNINSTNSQIYEFTKNEISTSEEPSLKEYLHKTDNLEPYTTDLIDLQAGFFNKTVCDRGMCCDFDLKYNFSKELITNETSYYRYRVAVFNGVRSFTGMATGGLKVCGVISCLDDEATSCGHLHGPTVKLVPTTFERIDISVKSAGTDESFFMPVSLTDKIVSLNATDFFFMHVDRHENAAYRMGLTKARSDLITFSIHGRYFPLDGKEATSGASFISPMILIVFGLSLCTFYAH